jgi:PAS domain S-box-containing protein
MIKFSYLVFLHSTMNSTVHELFLLAADLSQLKTKEEILKVFSERIGSVFPDIEFVLHSGNKVLNEEEIAICTSLKSYGFISFGPESDKGPLFLELIQNLCRMVAALLEKAEQAELLPEKERKLKKLLQEDALNLQKKEKELFETNEIFQHFLLYSPIYVFFKDSEIRSLKLSKNFEQMLGRPLEELLGKNMNDLFPSDFAARMTDDDKRILNSGKSEVLEEELNGKYYTTIKFPIILDGKPKYLAGFTIDTTESRKTDAALKESYSKYLAVFESTGSATLLVEADTTISLANLECQSLTGYTREELIGQKWTRYVEKESLEEMIKNHNLRRKDQSKAPKKYEVKLLNKKGEIRHALLDIGMVKETGQSIVSIIDITDRILAEQALIAKADELERFNRLMIGREIKMIELKKELNELLKKSGKNEKYKING